MTRHVAIALADDTTAESCGSCPAKYTYGPEADGYACGRFPGRIFGRSGYRRVPACVEAEKLFEEKMKTERRAVLRAAYLSCRYEAGLMLERSQHRNDTWSTYALEACFIGEVILAAAAAAGDLDAQRVIAEKKA